MAHTSPGAPLSVVLFANKTADETLSQWIDVRGKANVSFYCSSVGTTSSGVISFEEAAPVGTATNAPVFGATTGDYSVISTVAAADFTGDAQLAYHAPPNVAYAFVRARISTVIGGGGNVTVTLEAS